jgi:hypothetical protein
LDDPETDEPFSAGTHQKGLPVRKAGNFTAICEPIIWKMWEPRSFTTLWAFTACYSDSFFLKKRGDLSKNRKRKQCGII